MENNDLFKTILEMDDESTNFDLSDSIDYVPDSSDDKTVLDNTPDSDDYVRYGNGSGFTFDVEGIDDEVSETPLSNHLQPDMTLKENRYRIIKTIGAGGFGVVYLAFDTKLNIEVAMKELFPSSLVNRIPGEKKMVIYGKDNARQYAYLLDRFILEARSMAKFNSVKNIVNIFDCFQENNTAYIVMEYIKGKTLEQYVISQGGKLSPDKATEIMCDILDGLSAIHSKGIIHRDIKPKNIFITNESQIKIIDFGAARFSSTEEQIVTRYSKVLTPGFAPPEQYRKDSKQGPYTDIYAASAVYYYMVTGRIPEISVDRVVNDDIKPLSEVTENVPEHVERAVGRALELNSDLRLQSASEFKSGLLGNKIIRYVAEEKKMRFRRRILVIAATAAVLCIAAIGVVTYKLTHAEDISIDRLLSEDTTISIGLPLENNSSIANAQVTAWEGAARQFEAYVSENSERNVGIELQYLSKSTYDESIDTDNLPTVICSEAEYDFAKMDSMLRLISEDTTMLYSMYKNGTLPNDTYIIAFDPTVLYINEKLLASLSTDISDFTAIADILNLEHTDDVTLLAVNSADISYYSEIADISVDDSGFTPLERFCMGNTVFYIGHVSDNITIGDALPGLYKIAAAPDINGIRAVGYEWTIDADGSKDEINAAQLLLSYLTGEDMQDTLFVQQGYMVPVNPAAFDKFIEYNPNLAFLADEIDNLHFAE